jgi:N-acyl-D-aspartate/D-glutamate deacylase
MAAAHPVETIEGNVGLNVGFLVGHSTLRRIVLGQDWRREANHEEIENMARLVEASLSSGALGLSSSWSSPRGTSKRSPAATWSGCSPV